MNEEHITHQEGRTITLRLPKLSNFTAQTFILILLIGVGVIQTAQLYGLKTSVTNAKVSAPAATTGGSGSSLPTMVGGC